MSLSSFKFLPSFFLVAFLSFGSSFSNALLIGHFDNTRELHGLSTNLLFSANRSLVDAGHTLVSTSQVDAGFLSTVDAFYSGLISEVSVAEVNAMRGFVDNDGGFLFVQQDHTSSSPWAGPVSQILANWGITTSGFYRNDAGNTVIGNSDWVTSPNVLSSFPGSGHSVIDTVPAGFEVLGVDDLGRAILGVFDAGAGRSSDVFISTDLNQWTQWSDLRTQELWENIWTVADNQINAVSSPVTPVVEPSSLGLLSLGLVVLGFVRRKGH